jgi:hypothetical protein
VNITNLRPAPGIHIQASYAGFNFNAVVFANRSSGFSAMRQEDFAAGRPVRETTVVINKTVINNITIIDRPPVEPNPRVIITHPPARPVQAAVARPAFINEQGLTVSAKVGFKSAPPPVKAAPQVQALPGHKVVAPPPGVKTTTPNNATSPVGRPAQQQPTQVTPAGKPAVGGTGNPNQGGPPQGGQGPHPNSARPSELTAKPAPATPAQPAPKAGTEPGATPATNTNPPAKAADAKPAPNQKPGAKPVDKNKEGDKDKPKKDNPDNKNN